MSDQPTTPDRLAAFLADTARHFQGTLTPAGPQAWTLTNPAKHPNLLGPDGLTVSTDAEASLLDPELSLLAEGTPLLQTLVRRIREQGLSLFKGRYRWQWPAATVKARLKDGLIPARTRTTVSETDEISLRAVFRIRFHREFVQEDVLRLIVDGQGRSWSGARNLEGHEGLLEPVATLSLPWEQVQERYQRAVFAAEEALLPTIMDHKAELATLLKRETQRITTYYDEVEASGEYADEIDDPEAMAVALAALRKDRAKLLAEQRLRYQLGVQVQPVSLGLLHSTVTTVTIGDHAIVFHPLLADPILPICDGCARRVPVARFTPAPYCNTCAGLL
jgi:hypothetical protein